MPGAETAVGPGGRFVTNAIDSNILRETDRLFIVRNVLRNTIVARQPGYGYRNYGTGVLLLEKWCQRFQQE